MLGTSTENMVKSVQSLLMMELASALVFSQTKSGSGQKIQRTEINFWRTITLAKRSKTASTAHSTTAIGPIPKLESVVHRTNTG
jgi:hypothetical protein